jgi:hypothetical protein
MAKSGEARAGVLIAKWTRATKPIGRNGCVFGFVAVSSHGLIVEGFQVNTGPHGLFIEFPKTPDRNRALGEGCALPHRRRAGGIPRLDPSGLDASPSRGFRRARTPAIRTLNKDRHRPNSAVGRAHALGSSTLSRLDIQADAQEP